MPAGHLPFHIGPKRVTWVLVFEPSFSDAANRAGRTALVRPFLARRKLILKKQLNSCGGKRSIEMYIRLVAKELYQMIREVEELEKKLGDKTLAASRRAELEELLRKLRMERDRLRAILEGAKEK
jgi:hypothetical protein